MNKSVFVLALAAVLGPYAVAQSVFDGTWKVDITKVDWPTKPDVYVLQSGMYECKSCVPAHKVKADGVDQPVAGDPYVDTMAVKVVSDHEVQNTIKKGGKVTGTSTMTVSPDGKTMTYSFTDMSAPNGETVRGTFRADRVADGPAGSHAISGSWVTKKADQFSDSGLIWSYKVNGNELTMNSQTGQTYSAKMNGTEAQYKGDPGITSVKIRLLDNNTLEETDLRDGNVISVSKMVVGPDGKTSVIDIEDKLHGTTMSLRAMKQ